jgi:hypothetical protein
MLKLSSTLFGDYDSVVEKIGLFQRHLLSAVDRFCVKISMIFMNHPLQNKFLIKNSCCQDYLRL